MVACLGLTFSIVRTDSSADKLLVHSSSPEQKDLWVNQINECIITLPNNILLGSKDTNDAPVRMDPPPQLHSSNSLLYLCALFCFVFVSHFPLLVGRTHFRAFFQKQREGQRAIADSKVHCCYCCCCCCVQSETLINLKRWWSFFVLKRKKRIDDERVKRKEKRNGGISHKCFCNLSFQFCLCCIVKYLSCSVWN